MQGGAPGSLGKLVLPTRRCRPHSDVAEGEAPRLAADRLGLVRLPPYNLVQPITQSALLINRVRRVTYDVHEQDMGDLELNLFLNLGGHLRATPKITRIS